MRSVSRSVALWAWVGGIVLAVAGTGAGATRLTSQRQVLTHCPVVKTKCPPEKTVCKAMRTHCPRVPTTCIRGQTQCPIIETQCPAGKTRCPVDQTKCPPDSTICQPIKTRCPIASCGGRRRRADTDLVIEDRTPEAHILYTVIQKRDTSGLVTFAVIPSHEFLDRANELKKEYYLAHEEWLRKRAEARRKGKQFDEAEPVVPRMRRSGKTFEDIERAQQYALKLDKEWRKRRATRGHVEKRKPAKDDLDDSGNPKESHD